MKDTIQLVCNAYSDTEDWRYLLQATVRDSIEKHYDAVIDQLSKEIAKEEEIAKKSPLNEEIKSLNKEVFAARKLAEAKSLEYNNYMHDRWISYRSDVTEEEKAEAIRLKGECDSACNAYDSILKQYRSLTKKRDEKVRSLRASRRSAKQHRYPRIGYLKMIAAAIEYSYVDGSDKAIQLVMDALDNQAVQQFPNFCNSYLSLFDLPSIEELSKAVSDKMQKEKIAFTDSSEILRYNPNPYDLCMREDYDRASSYCVCSDMYYHIDHAKITDIVTRKGYASCIKLV